MFAAPGPLHTIPAGLLRVVSRRVRGEGAYESLLLGLSGIGAPKWNCVSDLLEPRDWGHDLGLRDDARNRLLLALRAPNVDAVAYVDLITIPRHEPGKPDGDGGKIGV